MIRDLSHPDRRARGHRPRRGFTLAEMLVIVGIILLVMALALPAFTVIVSSRSVESARNVVASALVRARGEAIRRGQPCGVFFYVDPDSGRNGIAIVTLDPLTDLDPYHEYMPFTRSTTPQRDYQGGTLNPLTNELGEPAMTADRVVVLGADGDPTLTAGDPLNPYPAAYHAFNGRPIILIAEKTREPPALDPDGDDTNEPGRLGTSNDPSSFNFLAPSGAPIWGNSVSGGSIGTLELISGIDPVLLSLGAGVQVILGETLESLAPPPAGDGPYTANDPEFGYKYAIRGAGTNDPDEDAFIERYASAGLILFNSEGHMIQAEYRIDTGSRLGRTIGLELVRDLNNAPISEYLVSGITTLGVVVYEKEAFESAASDGTALPWKGGIIATLDATIPQTPIDRFQPTDGDLTFLYPWGRRPQNIQSPTLPGDPRYDEYAEERWLDANTIPLMVNRYSGTLTEAE